VRRRAASVTPVDVDSVTRLIRDVAETEILPRFRKLAEAERWEKRPGSVVTVVDQRAEGRLASGLTAMTPGATIVGEEAVEQSPDALRSVDWSGPAWVIDPLDGTANFAAGKPTFAVLVAYVVAGVPAAAWIHNPIENVTAVAEAGAGAWIGERRLRVAAPAPLAALTGSLGPRLRRNRDFCALFHGVTNTGCCGIDYLALVGGRIHFAYYRGLKPWDHTPGVLIHREAGGHSACLDGQAYRPDAPGEGGLLLAPDRDVWHSMAAEIPSALAKVS
jgi:fructose-1,6-bisphosphatase/inositol monophosphatase family enzyme